MSAKVPALGSQSALVMGFETTYGTIAGAATGKKFGFMKAGVKGTKSLIDNMTLTSDTNLRDAIRGRQNAGGPLSFYLDPINAPFVFKAALGSYLGTGPSNWVHTMKMGAAQPPSFTVEEAFTFADASGAWVQALGCQIDSLKLSGKVDGYLEADCTIVGAKTQHNTTASNFTTPTDWTANPNPFENMMIAAADVLFGTMGSPAAFTGMTEWGLTINNNLFKNDYRVGGVGTRASSTRAKSRVELTMKCMFEDEASCYALLTNAANTPREWSVKYTIDSNTYLTIRIPRLFLEWNDPEITSGEPVTIDVKGVAAYDSSAQTQLVVTVGNNTADTVYA
jgi:hypothetical protein